MSQTTERKDGPTENGGVYEIRRFRDDAGLPASRNEAVDVEIVEFDERDRPIATRVQTIVHATWNRRFPGFQILAFRDRTYLIDIGSDRKPPLATIGWDRWWPDSIEFPRWRKL